MIASMVKLAHDQLADADRRHLLHPHLAPGTDERVLMVRGEGCTLWAADGAEYLDATGGGLWANIVGHGRAELADAARGALAELGFFCSFWEFGNPHAAKLAERLAALAPGDLNRILLTSGGSEGIELAVKAARRYHFLNGEPERTWVLGRRSSYHGMGHGGSSAADFTWLREGYGPSLPHFRLLSPTWSYHPELFDGQDPTDFAVAELEAAIAEIGPEHVAAFVGEPIQGVGGLLVPSEDYWPRIAATLTAHGILLVLDEVVTAFGRLGHWFAAQRYGVVPDLIVCAKGITSGYFPVGAILFRDGIADVLASGDHGVQLGFTYGGHPAGAAVALANLDIIEREELIERATLVGSRLREGLSSLESLDVVGEVRGEGMLAGIELVGDPHTRAGIEDLSPVTAHLRKEHGVIVRAAMGSALVLSPSLVMTEAEVDRLVDALGNTLSRTTPDGQITSDGAPYVTVTHR